jgi:hypothetical protein
MPVNVVPFDDNEEPPSVYQAAVMKSHELAARAARWKRRAAWAFTAGLFAGTVIAASVLAVLGG